MPPNNTEEFLDRFTGMDELIAGPVMDKLTSIDNNLGQMGGSENDRQINLEDRPRVKRTIDLSAQVAPFRTDPNDDQIEFNGERTGKVPFDGWVDGFIAGWPDGAEQNAGISLRHDEEGTIFFPAGKDDFTAFNDFNNEFQTTFPVEKGEVLEVNYLNRNNTAMPLNALIQFKKKFPEEELNIEGRR